MNNHTYGYQLFDGQFRLGTSGPRGLFVAQTSSLQPCGHWVEPDGTLRAQHDKPRRFTVFMNERAGTRYVSYEKPPVPVRVPTEEASLPRRGYGYRFLLGRLRLGVSGPRDMFLPQVREMQPVGHWVESDGLCPQHGPRSPLTVLLNMLRGVSYVHYPQPS